MASIIETWVNDKLHDILGISDNFISQFLLGLARKSADPDEFIIKLRETGTVEIDSNMINFAHELWNKVSEQFLCILLS
jgi:pre-mRNA-splicing factor ATP-dependent RNA helicase DHX16